MIAAGLVATIATPLGHTDETLKLADKQDTDTFTSQPAVDPDKVERAAKTEKVERVEKAEKPEKSDKPEKVDKRSRTEKSELAESRKAKQESMDLAQDILLQAMGLIGVTYRYGGNSPETGLDCSGFIRYVFKQALNIALPHNAFAISRLGDEIEKEDLKAGDLVFFNTLGRKFSHVGIYLGDDRFIHSPSSGGKIQVVRMTDSYWHKRFNGARRVSQETVSERSPILKQLIAQASAEEKDKSSSSSQSEAKSSSKSKKTKYGRHQGSGKKAVKRKKRR
ncbi:C40 family peptidase [Parachitinimonas caeni]|uniref:C40 family peptidase n=1 Tax=Parachitinimonas caeni TaxID=3031301 RepID=A0ABT7DYN3_9NEIS|nr:C40 family peptidase [Parachitinimonas caeni]MDK2125156.1 C40 family peptidase [Parachitinimonas caeni]